MAKINLSLISRALLGPCEMYTGKYELRGVHDTSTAIFLGLKLNVYPGQGQRTGERQRSSKHQVLVGGSAQPRPSLN